MRCSACGDEHDLLDPAFGRPDVIFAMTGEEKRGRVLERNDMCALRGDDVPDRYFFRCVLPVRLLDRPGTVGWGIWAEVNEVDAKVIYDLWDAPNQAASPAMSARLANNVPAYPETIGLPVDLRLTGPTSRPSLSFSGASLHPFAVECRAGVSVHRVAEWLARMSVR